MERLHLIALFVLPLTLHVLGSPLLYDVREIIWKNAETRTTSAEQREHLQRWRRASEFEEFGSFGAIMAFGHSVSQDVQITCTACKAAGESLMFFLEEGYSEGELLEFVYSICTDLQIMSDPICNGFTKNIGPEVVMILNTTTLSPLQVCSFLVGKSCGDVENPGNQWSVSLPDVPKPPVSIPKFPANNTDTLTVLHISDTHIDVHYQEGSAAECNDPLCCRAQSGPPDEGTRVAGKWGDYKCDTPMITFDNFLQQASTAHKNIDYIIWTGDLPAHDLWDQTQQTLLDIIRTTATKIRDAFPGVPVYPAIGNHDSAPVNSFPGPEIGGAWNISWLYDELDDVWGANWVENDETSSTIRKGAFYSTLVRPGFRIISLNMNYCYLSNWWLIVNSTDPNQELLWLGQELQKAENLGEKVHIIGHIPPGHTDCLNAWTLAFSKIITRYENTVAAQFYGHTHKDEFEVYYDLEQDSRPVAVSFIGPAITTYTDINSGYRIYHVDGDRDNSTRFVLDHDTYIFDLEEANRVGEPQWRKSYSMREEFQMNSLLPADWDLLYRRMLTDDEAFQLYYKHYSKESPVMEPCDEECKDSRLCGIRSCTFPKSPRCWDLVTRTAGRVDFVEYGPAIYIRLLLQSQMQPMPT